MRKTSNTALKVCCLFFVLSAYLSSMAMFSISAHANSVPFSAADIALIRSLQAKKHAAITVKSNSTGDLTKTIDLDNSSNVKAALQKQKLSSQMHEAITQIVTTITITTIIPGRSINLNTNLAQPQISQASYCATASGSITGENALGIALWQYGATQPFCGNGTNITPYRASNYSQHVWGFGWSFSGQSSSLPNPSLNVPGVIQNNIGVFNYAPFKFVNIQTVTPHIYLYMFGGGYWDVGTSY